MKLSTKVLVVVPLFLIAGAASEYLNYYYQSKQTLEQAQDAANAQAKIIRESLVTMMINEESVDDDYLARINTAGDIQNLHILFFRDSLHLARRFTTAERMQLLGRRELRELSDHRGSSFEVFSSGNPLWTPGGDYLDALIPFRAEAKCQRCHDVSTGHVLGVAHMTISLSKASLALRENARRSTWIFIIFAVVAIIIDVAVFWWFVSIPVQKLVRATEVIGSGNLDRAVDTGNSKDELGKLAVAFNEMQQKLKYVQLELIHKERLSIVGQMASSIIHDFRGPMSAIQLAFQVLEDERNMSQEKRADIYRVSRSSVERMNRMIQELLDFSRGETKLNLHQHEVEEFVNSVALSVRMHLQNRGIHFETEHGFRGKALLDPGRLERALINIINNAEDALPRGGTIRLETVQHQNFLVFQIHDNGLGVPGSIRDKIFEPFVTAGKVKGTGLGLAIARRIVEQHGGDITFRSESDKGTTFVVRIPVNHS